MATREIKHKLGTITYEYNDQVPWTETDQKMADGLAQCLLVNEKASETVDAILKRSIELSKHIKRLTEYHETVGELLKKAQDIAGGYVGAIELGQYAIADQLSEATNLANDAIQQQNKDATAVHADYSSLIDDYNKQTEQEEIDEDGVYAQISGLFTLGYETENLATELASFDRASENVRAVLSVTNRTQEGKLNCVFNTTRDYELLLSQINGQQKVWDEYCSRLILIEYIGKLRSGTQTTSFN